MIALIFIAALIPASTALPNWDEFSRPEQLAGLLMDLEDFDGFGVNADPTPCCLPKQWQGTVKTLAGVSDGGPKLYGEEEGEGGKGGGGGGKAKASTMKVFVDETNKRIAGQLLCPVSKVELFSFILTFKAGNNSGATLNVFNKTAKTCMTKDVAKAVFKDQCIPADAKFVGSVNLGPTAGGLAVNSFVFNVSDKRSAMFGNSVVTPADCLPVVSHAVGSVGRRFAGLVHFEADEEMDESDERPKPRPKPRLGYVSSSYFYNLEAKISDPTVFTPPDYCPKSGAIIFKKSQPDRSGDDFDLFADHLKWKSYF